MRRTSFGASVAVSIVALLAGCTTPPAHDVVAPTPTQEGGTLRLGTTQPLNLDPQRSYSSQMRASELFRCCLLRTLLSYNGLSADEGGGVVRPDLASRMPEVSSDRLTWTFRLRADLYYAPPYEQVPIVAGDVIRALEREARLGQRSYAFYYEVIDGYSEFAEGQADSISGLLAPDERTLIVRLTTPTADFGDRMAQAAAAPIPPAADGEDAPFGAATGHDRDYGPYLIASGPYMLGSIPLFGPDAVVSSLGVLPSAGTRLYLVRNPSWSRASDPLRAALPNRIEIRFFPSSARLDAAIIDGRVHLEFDEDDASPTTFRDSQDKATTLIRAVAGASNMIQLLTMNLAVPPLDDVHVRRALTMLVDRRAVAEAVAVLTRPEYTGGATAPGLGTLATHVIPDGIEGDLLVGYDPYRLESRNPIRAARRQMARSHYDTDGDGACDKGTCTVATMMCGLGPMVPEILADDLAPVGLIVEDGAQPSFRRCLRHVGDPRNQVAMTFVSWMADYANASTFFLPLFRRPTSVLNRDVTMLGATRSQLDRWGYRVRLVPSIGERIEACAHVIGDDQVRCWALLDKYLMERIVPVVPILAVGRTVIVSNSIENVVFDASFGGQISLDRLQVVD